MLTREEQCRIARIKGCWQNNNLLDLRLLTGWELLVDLKLTRALDSVPGNKASRDAFSKAMDHADLHNFIEGMYAAGLSAKQTVVDPQTQALSHSEVEVVMSMPHHSHLAAAGQTVLQLESRAERGAAGGSQARVAPEKPKERVPTNRRGPQRERAVPTKEPVAIAGLEPHDPPRVTTQGPLQKKRRQNDPVEGEKAEDSVPIGIRQQKRARQASQKVTVAVAGEVPTNGLDSFAAYTEFLTDLEQEFLFHL
ncbi:uncharacterized protein LOC133714049 [Rosa rugosa]|uniref:uncharacterized protein LOC133714049 n=1 Tax=Rosa rugosa TaxID=74645 RepID=UPI002B41819C|nr:uncharacterized protein LOC133714049 [Rosa rugosa]XP_061996051.1 uncharacterized protein LOC133714049 [Rosa rugosa]XP_061996059.1 uncharacterized protein LOC133714049 [Rosa rugosa]XP_061996062.1 uncharacterized protein LOC133714049 [Rosa rugosa]